MELSDSEGVTLDFNFDIYRVFTSTSGDRREQPLWNTINYQLILNVVRQQQSAGHKTIYKPCYQLKYNLTALLLKNHCKSWVILHCMTAQESVCGLWVLQNRPLTSFTEWVHCQVKAGQHVQSSRQPSQMDVRCHFFTSGETAVPSVDNLHFLAPSTHSNKACAALLKALKEPGSQRRPISGLRVALRPEDKLMRPVLHYRNTQAKCL